MTPRAAIVRLRTLRERKLKDLHRVTALSPHEIKMDIAALEEAITALGMLDLTNGSSS